MSKGEIIQHIGEGKYRVRQKLAIEKVQREIEGLNVRIAQLAVTLPSAKAEALQAETAIRSKVTEINQLIPGIQQGTPGVREQIASLQSELVQLQANARQLQLKVSDLTAENLAALKRRNQLSLVPEGRELELWCADYSVELSGDVGIIDINDEGGQGAIIFPGYDGDAAFSPTRDGELFPNLAQSGPQIYLNAAILPGVQKWMPRYRLGTIALLQTDLCTVDLDPATSSAQDLDINVSERLTEVPIKYMECNGSAFAEGDRVVVRFTAHGPLVVGFESNPRSCLSGGIVFVPGFVQSSLDLVTYGEPFEDMGGYPINPPLGTTGGTNPMWSITPASSAAGYEINKGINETLAGNRNWFGEGKILSWHGPVSRVYDHEKESFQSTTLPWHNWWTRSTKVFSRLAVLIDLSEQPVDGFQYVCGAAIRSGAAQDYLYVVSSDQAEGVNQQFRVYRWPVNLDSGAVGGIEIQATITSPENCVAITDWYFNAVGDRAVCTFRNRKIATSDPDSYSRVYKSEYSATSNQASETLLWDQYQSVHYTFTNVETRERTIRRNSSPEGCTGRLVGPSLIESIQMSGEGPSSELIAPIYVEYVGNQQVTVSIKTPAYVRSDNASMVYREITKEYPNPCAGEEGQGPTVVRTYERDNNRGQTRVVGTSQPRQIITSQGQVLAEEKFSQKDNTNYSYTFEREQGTLSGCGNSTTYDSGAYLLQFNLDQNLGGWEQDGGSMVIDARNNFCAAIESYFKRIVDAEISGKDPMDDAIYVGGENQLLAPATSASVESDFKFVRTFHNGALVDEVEFDRFDYPIPDWYLREGGYWEAAITGLTATQCDDFVTSQQTTYQDEYPRPQFVPRSRPDFLEGAAVSQGGRTARVMLCKAGGSGFRLHQYLSGAPGNLPAGLFERPLAAPFIMHRLTVA